MAPAAPQSGAMTPPHDCPSTSRDRRLRRCSRAGGTLVMGILNVTPDSFSDGGQFLDPAAAVAHARRMAAEGADILDVGAEFDAALRRREAGRARGRARAPRAGAAGEIVELGLPVSIDTIKAKVAAWALEQGAAILNDVWGLQRDPDMARVAAEHGVPVIVMHNREAADPAIDIMADVKAFFARSLDIAARAGIARERIVLDPGIGFGKTPEQSIAMIARLARAALVRPAAADGAVAQALHRQRLAVEAGRAHRRLDRRQRAGGARRRRHRARA